MLGRLNHIGVATPSIADAIVQYRRLFGPVPATDPRPLVEQGVNVSFVRLADVEIELIEPLGGDGPLTRYLERHPQGGQHHVCFEVDDLVRERDALVASGARVLWPAEPRVGAHGVPVIFLDPKLSGGVLIELMQKPAGH